MKQTNIKNTSTKLQPLLNDPICLEPNVKVNWISNFFSFNKWKSIQEITPVRTAKHVAQPEKLHLFHYLTHEYKPSATLAEIDRNPGAAFPLLVHQTVNRILLRTNGKKKKKNKKKKKEIEKDGASFMFVFLFLCTINRNKSSSKRANNTNPSHCSKFNS